MNACIIPDDLGGARPPPIGLQFVSDTARTEGAFEVSNANDSPNPDLLYSLYSDHHSQALPGLMLTSSRRRSRRRLRRDGRQAWLRSNGMAALLDLPACLGLIRRDARMFQPTSLFLLVPESAATPAATCWRKAALLWDGISAPPGQPSRLDLPIPRRGSRATANRAGREPGDVARPACPGSRPACAPSTPCGTIKSPFCRADPSVQLTCGTREVSRWPATASRMGLLNG
jgi:hypothetical protein